MKKPLLLTALLSISAFAALAAVPVLDDARTVDYADAAPDIVDVAVADARFSTLVTALQAAKLVDALKGEGPFTVFAPTNDAFAKLPKETLSFLLDPKNVGDLTGILTFHVLPGKFPAADVVGSTGEVSLNGQKVDFQVMTKGEGREARTSVSVNGAQVLITDIEASNGIIHVIDTVILPATDDLVATAKSAGTFNTLLAAARAAGLVETLTSPGPFTVLAPTDSAFDALPAGTVESLLKPENKEKLAGILKLHVLAGRSYSNQVVTLDSVQPLGRKSLAVRVSDDGVTIGGAKVLRTDIDASNGVIHVIDKVIL